MTGARMKKYLAFTMLLVLCLALPGRVQAAAEAIPASLTDSHASLLPWLDYYVDETATDV